jgi:tetratricopeptide (TPR) repeat protein
MIRLALVLAIAVPMVAHAGPSDPQPEAQRLLAEGRSLYDQGDYAGALDRFERVNAIVPKAGLILNIGTTLAALGRNVEAANAYQSYLDHPRDDDKLRGRVQSALAALDATLGRLTFDVEQGAELQVGDGAWIAADGVGTLRVEPGTYVVRARHGERTATVTGRVEPGAADTVVVVLAEPVVAPDPVEDDDQDDVPPPEHAHSAWPRIALIGGAVIGAGAIGGGIALGVRATHRYDEARTLCGAGCDGDVRDRAAALSSRGDRDRILAATAIAGGVAIAVTGVVLWARGRHHHSDAPAVSVQVAPDRVGLVLTGSL